MCGSMREGGLAGGRDRSVEGVVVGGCDESVACTFAFISSAYGSMLKRTSAGSKDEFRKEAISRRAEPSAIIWLRRSSGPA